MNSLGNANIRTCELLRYNGVKLCEVTTEYSPMKTCGKVERLCEELCRAFAQWAKNEFFAELSGRYEADNDPKKRFRVKITRVSLQCIAVYENERFISVLISAEAGEKSMKTARTWEKSTGMLADCVSVGIKRPKGAGKYYFALKDGGADFIMREKR